MSDSPSFAAAARARRVPFETPPAARRRPRLLLVGLPMFAVFAAFGAIVWLAYEHGADVPPVGEPPLIKAPATALKLPPDEADAPTVADQGEVRDLLTDTPPDDQLERLLPPPEEPLAPTLATPAPDTGTEGAPAPTPPAPGDTAAVDQPPAAPAAPADQPESPPAEAAPPPAPPAPPPAQAATPAPQFTPPPAQAAAPPQVAATTPAEPPRQAPLAVERQSPAPAEPNPVSSVPQPSPREAEAALDALLAEVTQSATPPSPPPAPDVARPAPTAPVQPPPAVASAPRPAEPAREPATVSPFTEPGPEVTAIAPDRPSARQSASAASAARPVGPAANGGAAALDAGYRIQLAAVRDEADARRAWDLFLVDLGSVLSGVQPFIERAETANGVFYRVQIGPFASLPQAETLCDELKRRNASCFVIRR